MSSNLHQGCHYRNSTSKTIRQEYYTRKIDEEVHTEVDRRRVDKMSAAARQTNGSVPNDVEVTVKQCI